MNPRTLSAFSDELEKIAAGPKIFHDPSLLQLGLVGKYIPPSEIHSTKPQAEYLRNTIPGIKPGQGLLAMTPRETIRASIAKPERANAAYNITRRHEMTHWLRERRGKMKGIGQPGLMNVGRTIREELAGHLSGIRARGTAGVPFRDKAMSVLVGVPASLKAAYPRGVLRAVLRK